MFWIELYLIFQISLWFVVRLGLNFSIGEQNALALLLGLGVKSFLLFVFLTLGLARFIGLPIVLSSIVYVLFFIWIKARPLIFESLRFESHKSKGLLEYSGFGTLFILLVLGLLNAWFFPITGADGVWHHVKGMVYSSPIVDFESEQIIPQFRQYPPLIGLLYGWLISSGFERISVFFPLLYACFLFIFYYRSCEHFKNSMTAGLATIVLGTTPYLWWHSFLPFLDLTAGIFYAAGVLYWFLLIKNILGPSEYANVRDSRALALLSGIFFGMASWTRPEFVLLTAAPLFLLVCALDRQEGFVVERNSIIVCLAIPSLLLPSLWFAVLLNFDDPLDNSFKQLIIGCTCLWIGLGLVLSRITYFTPRTAIKIGVFSVLTCLTGLFIFLSPVFSPWTTLAVRFFRLFAVHIFFAGTIFLLIFLFVEKLRQLPIAEKKLGVLLVLFILTQFFIYAYSGLKWPTFLHYVKNTFFYPGDSVNLSDTRGSIAIYPAFVFFVFCFQTVNKGITHGRVKRFLLSIIGVNLIIIGVIFAGPRINFIADNLDKSYEQRAESSGPFDLPNQFKVTYRVAHQIKDYVKEGDLLFLPSGKEKGSFRSVMSQVLFSQKLTFENDPFFWRDLKERKSPIYLVRKSGGEAKLCSGSDKVALGNTGFVLCKLDKL